jgi:hypothetical protein
MNTQGILKEEFGKWWDSFPLLKTFTIPQTALGSGREW